MIHRLTTPLFLTAVIAAGCTSDEVVDISQNAALADKPISFRLERKNIVRANSKFQDKGHYNFGVFGYKSTDTTNPIMANYLVGYNSPSGGKGYYMTIEEQTTLGDASESIDGESYWAYEKLGSSDYTYTGNGGYYTSSQTQYMSNIDHQYLHYWDKNAATTTFYAYAPYINGDKTATFDPATRVLTIPDGSLHDGYDDLTAYEYMFAAREVSKVDYGHDIELAFKRLSAKVNIKFYETIDGYSARILDLNGTAIPDVQATPAIVNDGNYTAGQYYQTSGFSVNMSNVSSPTLTQLSGQTATNTRPLVFAEPTEEEIGTSRETATASPTTYFAIPKNNSTGFTFHVSYELTSTTGEKIVVKNATAHVPADKCNWLSNTAYTYIFRISRDTNGSTDPDDDSKIDPTDPSINKDKALFPIVFDTATILDWVPAADSEHDTN